jgi:cytochrome c
MRCLPARTVSIAATASLVGLLSAGAAPAPAATSSIRVLAFTKTAGFRHASIPAAVQALEQLGAKGGFAVDATEDASAFSDGNLARYDAVVFALTTGDILNDSQQAAFQRYIGRGGGFAGIHSASDTEHDWPWYGDLVGAFFRIHPAIQPAVITVTDRSDPSTLRLPRRWQRTDEWYAFATNPRGGVHVLATLDESTYSPGGATMGSDHPIAWSHVYAGGRAWYTAGGHTIEAYAEPLFLGHVLGGILWAVGVDPPRIMGVATTTRNRRLSIVAHHSMCPRCRAKLVVLVRGHRVTFPMTIDATTARVTTRALPPGLRRFSIVLEDRATGSTTTTRRSARVL